jgi:glycosyltransferase involved in cell wall biosynthesis
MHILIINTLYPPYVIGGAERSVSLLAEALVRSGDQVTVVSLHPDLKETVETLNGVRVYRLPMDNRYWPFGRGTKPCAAARLLWHMGDAWNRRAAKRVGRILDQEEPDVVHTNAIAGFSVAIWGEARKRNIRLVHTLRDYYLLCSRSALFRNGSTCMQRCTDCKALTANRKSASQLVDAVISISEYVLDRHVQCGYFSGSPSSVIYNIAGVGKSLSPTLRSRNGPQNTLIFGYIGRLEEEKGIEVVLEAVGCLSGSNWRLRIAGAGLDRYVNALKQKFSDPRIEWLGFADAREFYPSIDVTIISSVWPEPLSRTVIETFGACKSAICAQSGGIPEIARLGKVVETYPANNSRALATVMDRAMLDVDLWRGGGFRDADTLHLFSDTSIATRYRAIYQDDVKDNEIELTRSDALRSASKKEDASESGSPAFELEESLEADTEMRR